MYCTSSQQRLGLMIYAFWEEKTSPPHLTELEVKLYSELDYAVLHISCKATCSGPAVCQQPALPSNFFSNFAERDPTQPSPDAHLSALHCQSVAANHLVH